MGIKSHIAWTNSTVNFWQGCRRKSEGCRFCYMFREKKRYGQDPSIVVRSAKPTFTLPLRKSRDGSYKIPSGSKVFVCSWSDFFIEKADPWRDEAWEIMRQRPDLIFQVLTKRIERVSKCLPADWGDGWPHVWLGVSTEDQATANERIPILLNTPAAVRFISAEPLLSHINLSDLEIKCGSYDALAGLVFYESGKEPADAQKLDLVIVGGESGPGARRCNLSWIRSIVEQCRGAGVAVFVKQIGKHPIYSRSGGSEFNYSPYPSTDPKGGDMSEWPKDLRFREFPIFS